MKFTASTLTVLSTLSLTVPAQGQPSIADVLMDPNFSTLAAALNATGLDAALVGGGPFTIFAPDNAAFEAFEMYSPGTINMWIAMDILPQVLLHHVANGVVESGDIVDGMMVEMLSTESATLMAGPPAMIDDSNIVSADTMVQEGVVHSIDFPIVPPSVEVLPGIFLAANATGQFTILLGLIEAVGLADQLNSPGPFTVFAPTDEAFAKIPNLEELANDPVMVIGILTNHVVGGYSSSDMLSDGQTLTTLGRQTLTVSIMEGMVMINEAQVTQPDIFGSNGVVHAIDTVILPAAGEPTGDMTMGPVGSPTEGGGGTTMMPTTMAGSAAASKSFAAAAVVLMISMLI